MRPFLLTFFTAHLPSLPLPQLDINLNKPHNRPIANPLPSPSASRKNISTEERLDSNSHQPTSPLPVTNPLASLASNTASPLSSSDLPPAVPWAPRTSSAALCPPSSKASRFKAVYPCSPVARWRLPRMAWGAPFSAARGSCEVGWGWFWRRCCCCCCCFLESKE